MSTCGICWEAMKERVYVLNHKPKNNRCKHLHGFHSECILQALSHVECCPFCRCNNVQLQEYIDANAFERAAELELNPSFLKRQIRWVSKKSSQLYEGCTRRYNAYKTKDMEILAIAPALMVLLQRVARLPASYIPIGGLDVFVGGSVATLFGAFVAMHALGSSSFLPPWGWHPQEQRKNGIAMMAGVAATALTVGVDPEAAIGAGFLAITGLVATVFSSGKEDTYLEKRFLRKLIGLRAVLQLQRFGQ